MLRLKKPQLARRPVLRKHLVLQNRLLLPRTKRKGQQPKPLARVSPCHPPPASVLKCRRIYGARQGTLALVHPLLSCECIFHHFLRAEEQTDLLLGAFGTIGAVDNIEANLHSIVAANGSGDS